MSGLFIKQIHSDASFNRLYTYNIKTDSCINFNLFLFILSHKYKDNGNKQQS